MGRPASRTQIRILPRPGAMPPCLGAMPLGDEARRMAEQLAKVAHIPDWGGWYSLAQHLTCLAEAVPPDLRPWALLSGAAAVLVGRLSPAARIGLAAVGAEAALAAIESAALGDLHRHLGLAWPVPAAAAARIAQARERVRATEDRDLWDHHNIGTAQPLPKVIRPWPWPQAMDAWNEAWDRASAFLPPVPRSLS